MNGERSTSVVRNSIIGVEQWFAMFGIPNRLALAALILMGFAIAVLYAVYGLTMAFIWLPISLQPVVVLVGAGSVLVLHHRRRQKGMTATAVHSKQH